MKHIKTGTRRGSFDLLAETRDAQAAMMTLPPGRASEATPGNEHPRSEQWLLVLAGTGEATIGRRRGALRRVKLSKNSLLLIEKGDLHQIRNTGQRPLRTINFYTPPAYDKDAEVRPAVKRKAR